MVLGPFAGTKEPRLPGQNPATQKITLTRGLGTQVRSVYPSTLSYRKTPRWIPANNKRE